MTSFIGNLELGEDGKLCLKIRIAPQNPSEELVPLEELYEEYLNHQVKVDINFVKPISEVYKK